MTGVWMTSYPEAMGWEFLVIFQKAVRWDLSLGEASWDSNPGEANWFLSLGEPSPVGATGCAAHSLGRMEQSA